MVNTQIYKLDSEIREDIVDINNFLLNDINYIINEINNDSELEFVSMLLFANYSLIFFGKYIICCKQLPDYKNIAVTDFINLIELDTIDKNIYVWNLQTRDNMLIYLLDNTFSKIINLINVALENKVLVLQNIDASVNVFLLQYLSEYIAFETVSSTDIDEILSWIGITEKLN